MKVTEYDKKRWGGEKNSLPTISFIEMEKIL